MDYDIDVSKSPIQGPSPLLVRSDLSILVTAHMSSFSTAKAMRLIITAMILVTSLF